MKMPWVEMTGLAKAATVLAAILLVSLGLCGLNYGLFAAVRGDSQFLIVTAFVELAGIFVGVVGLVVVAGVTLVQVLMRAARGGPGEDPED
jgi:hypothetical protein